MLKALLLRKKIDDAKKALAKLREKDADIEKREAELAAAIDEVTEETTAEERAALEETVDSFNAEKKQHEEETGELERKIAGLEAELAETEAENEKQPEEQAEEKRERNLEMKKAFKNMTEDMRARISNSEATAAWLGEIRSAVREKRTITNVGVTIPVDVLDLLRENIMDYSKLYKHVRVRAVNGEARQPIMGAIPEAIWVECCAALNEMNLGFNDATVDCFKVGGYFALCKANVEDSDIDLAGEVLDAIAAGIGLALDKAILYGRNASGTQNMPQGIVSRLAQTAQPTGYPATARTWVDLHTTHMLTIASTVTDVELFKALLMDSAVISGKYARGEKVWVMNELTYNYLRAQGLTATLNGALVTVIDGRMPVIGGIVEVLDFIPNYVIIGGYFDLYLLAERAGAAFATSEHVRFLQDQIVYKGTARYDGMPIIAEAFVAIGVNGVTPTATMTFASDTANA